MHNVKKVALSEEKRAQKRLEDVERARKYNALSRAAMARRSERLYDEESLVACERALGINPEMNTLWNFRREILAVMHPEGRDDARRKPCEREFRLTQECLGLNPKSYPVWHHRQWVMEWGGCAWQHPIDLKLTAKLLMMDDRNFHCWTYRRFVATVAKVPAEAELKLTSDKVNANFSNYSAWHYRSKLLPQRYSGDELGPKLLEELQLVRNAFFCSPEDQSAWFYHRWLLAQLAQHSSAAVAPEAVLLDELSAVEELLELEPECKWPLLSAALLATALGRGGEATARFEACRRVDPFRAAYYDHQMAGA